MERTFLAYEDGRSERSYKQSMIRRVISVATPYEGSLFASILINRAEDLPYVKEFRAGGKGLIKKIAVDIATSRAFRNIAMTSVPYAYLSWTDLALESELVNNLHDIPYSRPVHVIYGKIRSSLGDVAKIAKLALSVTVKLPRIFSAVMFFMPSLLEDADLVKTVFDVLFNEGDFDAVVGEDSAKSTFSDEYITAFEGGITKIGSYWHNGLCHQADVSSLVFDLLEASDEKFDKSGVNSSAVSSVSSVSSVKSSGLVRSLPVNVKDSESESESESDDYFVNVLPLTVEDSEGNSYTGSGTVTIIPPANLTFRIESDEPILHNVYVSFMTENGGGFALMASKDEDLKEFVMPLDIQSTDTGIIDVHCFSQGEEDNVYISDTFRLVIQPNLELDGDYVNSITLMNPGLITITNVSSEVGAALFANTENGKSLDVTSPLMGTTWTADDPEIAEVTETGKILGKKSGSTVLRASYAGYEASVSVDVAVQYDVTPTPEPSSKDLFIMTRSLPEGKAGITYSAALDTTLSLSDVITWTVTGLPEILSCDSYGVINGKPVEPGRYSLSITASNGDESDSASLTLRINSADVEGVPIISTVSLPDAYVSKDYSFTLKAVGENISWSISESYLPSEFELSSEGVLSGIAYTEGSYMFTVTASNTYGYDSQYLTLRVVSAEPAPAPVVPPVTSPDNPVPVVSPDVSQDIEPEPEPESDNVIIGEDRTILSLSVSELAEVSNDTSMIAAVLPEITVNISDIYDFDAELFGNVRTGAKLIWHPFVRESVNPSEYEYADASNSDENAAAVIFLKRR